MYVGMGSEVLDVFGCVHLFCKNSGVFVVWRMEHLCVCLRNEVLCFYVECCACLLARVVVH